MSFTSNYPLISPARPGKLAGRHSARPCTILHRFASVFASGRRMTSSLKTSLALRSASSSSSSSSPFAPFKGQRRAPPHPPPHSGPCSSSTQTAVETGLGAVYRIIEKFPLTFQSLLSPIIPDFCPPVLLRSVSLIKCFNSIQFIKFPLFHT